MDAHDRRRALVIGVGKIDTFDAEFDELPFAVELAQRLAQALSTYRRGGFDVRTLLNPDRERIRDAVQDTRDDVDASAQLIHVISHGRWSEQSDRIEVVGSCGRGGTNNVKEWVSSAQEGGVPTLFLVDLCWAGRAAELQFAIQPADGELMAWVLAGARGDEPANNGAFTRAAAAVIEECGRDGLGTDPRLPFVSLREFARRISDMLPSQSLQTTSSQLHWSNPPILPNPSYQPDPVADQVAALDAPLQPFLTDEVADAAHFHGRAGAYFTGRQTLLDSLVPWLDGTGQGGLWVLTGTAGSGKSAVLGALVCAAHPALQNIAGGVRRRMADPPAVNPRLVAIHARQRGLEEIVTSIAHQLGLGKPDQYWIAAELIEQILAQPEPPVLIVDALDECVEAGSVQAVLLLPLAAARRADGHPAIRLLVGVRPWRDQFAPILDRAEKANRLTDLDQVEREQLYRDLRRYLIDLLAGVTGDETLASGVAARLADDHERRRGEAASTGWGHFLVASRYGSHIIEHPPNDDTDVATLLERVPVGLPQVLELELAAHPRAERFRAALAALAFAKGDGMPVELLSSVAAALGPADTQMFTSNDVRLYLRSSTDESGVLLLRLYHQGLADYLREHPLTPADRHDMTGPVFTALVGDRGGSGKKSWKHAPAYLRRSAIQHAADAGVIDKLLTDGEFLVYSESEPLLRELHRARTEEARLSASIYRSAHHLLSADPESRRRLLRLTALRYGAAAPTFAHDRSDLT